MRPDVPAGMAMPLLPFFDEAAAWAGYDAAARALPGCEHNQAWKELGPGRPGPPDCEHNRPWRAEIAVWRQWHLDALDNAREQPDAA